MLTVEVHKNNKLLEKKFLNPLVISDDNVIIDLDEKSIFFQEEKGG